MAARKAAKYVWRHFDDEKRGISIHDVYVMIIRTHITIVLKTLLKKFTSKYCKIKYNVKYIAIC